jgi:ubiquinone/menaquinone biosynthesis C-methylase UbiE
VTVGQELLDEDALSLSSVVANNAMNRDRQLTGVNSYERALGFDPLSWLCARAAARGTGAPGRDVAWLDLCCGSGRALIQAASQGRHDSVGTAIAIMGVDLVNAFEPRPPGCALELITASVASWSPPRSFDLITCVHGLHYVGDKLAVIARAVNALTDSGLFVADFDATSIRLPDGRPANRLVAAAFRTGGLSYDARRHRITCHGRREIQLPLANLGADDRAGPNYTHQPAVHSYYRRR